MLLPDDVAVIVPVYNRAGTVLEALDSVAAQTVRPGVLLVVDDGSTDGTAESVRRWSASRGSRLPVQVIEQSNAGASAARNRGVVAAGDHALLAFLDSDDLWPPDYLERSVAALAARPEAVATTCNQRYVCHDDCGTPTFRKLEFLDTSGLAENAAEWLFLSNYGITSSTVVRADAFRRVGGYDPELENGEDWKLYLHLSLQGEWLHVKGRPVTIRFGRSISRGEEGHLQLKGEDRYLTWVRMIERFIADEGGDRAIRRAVYSPRLARRWYSLGRSLMRSGRYATARMCFRHSIRWRKSYHKAWLRLLRSYFPPRSKAA